MIMYRAYFNDIGGAISQIFLYFFSKLLNNYDIGRAEFELIKPVRQGPHLMQLCTEGTGTPYFNDAINLYSYFPLHKMTQKKPDD